MRPNIGRAGRIARAISGLLCIVAGGALWLVDWPGSMTIRGVVTAVLIAAGAFQLFEAKKSWCVARACGLKTPM